MHPLSPFTGRALSLGLFVLLASALAPARATEDPPIDLKSLVTVESRRRALVDLQSLSDRRRREGEKAPLVRSLNPLGELLLSLNDLDAALAAADEALAAARRSGDLPLLADTLVRSGVVRRSRGEHEAAHRLFDEALALSRRLGYRRGEAESLTESGSAYFYTSEMPKAVERCEAALAIWRETGDRRGEARALYYLGAPYMRLGRVREAAAALKAAAAAWGELGYRTDQASALVELNFLAMREGQWKLALSLLNQIGPLITDREAEPFLAGQVATSFGEVYEAYGQLEAARRYYDEAHVLYRDYARDARAAVDAGRKSGRVQARLGDYEGAVERIGEELRLAEKIRNRFMAAASHEDLGRVHLAAGFRDRAVPELSEAAKGYEGIGSRREWARTHAYMGQAYFQGSDLDAASHSYREALRVFQEIGDYTNEAAVRFGLGKLEMERQNLDEAGAHLKRSIELTERLRENAASKDLRSSFLASVHDRYESYVEWLMRLHAARPGGGFDVAAFEASEMGRARSLLDSLRDHHRELRQAADPSLLLDEEMLQKEEQRLLDRRAALQSVGGDPAALAGVESELARVRARYEAVEAQINSDARFNDLLRPAPFSFREIREQITDPETALLEFSLGDAKSYLWVVTPGGLQSFELPDRRTIERAALRLAELLADPGAGADREGEVREAATDLSRLILAPAAGALSYRRLIVVSDGVLQYIPFQALADPSDSGEPLIARHEVVNAPSASTLLLVRRETSGRRPGPKLLAAFGDPAFPSTYDLMTRAAPQRGLASATVETLEPTRLQRLFYARQELNVLGRLAQGDECMIYSGFDATRDRLKELDLSQYRILHFATHGLLNAKQPELSGLVLSIVGPDGRPANGFVGLADIYNLRAPVDLVVLSACRTALGKDMRGEGLVGLTRGFLYAGASGVVSSLWKVDDEATAELMKRFYSNMLEGGMTPAAALREAQNSIRREPQWRSPYYWAAFTLQGEYRQVIKPPGPKPASDRVKMVGAAALLVALGGAAWWLARRRARLSVR